MRNESISVCMATYNGEKYLKEQIDSILIQLQDFDELVIVDDNSIDSTREILNSYSDHRIKIIHNEQNIGVNKNFEKAIISSHNKYIFLADQDDIWIPARIDIMFHELAKPKALVVTGNMLFIDGDGAPMLPSIKRLDSSDSAKKNKNIWRIFLGKAAYFGSAMAFSRDLCEVILPFPDFIESHDLWIAMAGIQVGGNIHCNNRVLYRRIHSNNVSLMSRKVFKVFLSRLIFVRQLLELKKRKDQIRVS